ncbi:hypothetical protein BJX62DRAFT_250157 [Aspergillus germanicus]
MVDVGGIIGYTTTTGIEALNVLNKWLDSKETAKAWYGRDSGDFLKVRRGWIRLLRKKYKTPEIEHVFTIQKEDWQIVMEESLPVAHTWYRKRKDESGECSWLPLYWACRDQLGRKKVLQRVDVALASIGLVSGLPAARLDLWGLIVMAYSNGARARVTTAEGGGFNATLLCKHFILTISQYNVNAPIIGHLEPREHPADSHEALTVDESRYLLEYGHTFSPQGVTTGWVLNGKYSDPPPAELVDGRSELLLTRTVLDSFQASWLKQKTGVDIIKYAEEWAKFMATKERKSGKNYSSPDPIFSQRLRENVNLDTNVVGESQTLHELQAELGMLSYGYEHHDDDHKLSNDELLPGDMINKLMRIRGLVVRMLRRLKLLFLHDNISLIDDFNPFEALYHFEAYEKLIRTLTQYHLAYGHAKDTGPVVNAKQGLDKLLDYHFAILARARTLNFCQQIPATLSVRNTGSTVLLS